MNLSHLRHATALALKKAVYARRGEPYSIKGTTLRFTPGTRPVRLKYINSPNDSVRYDALQVSFLTEGLKEGDTAIDIGAHSGQYSLLMAAFCGHSGRVISFEPDPYAREAFLRNVSLNPELRAPLLEPLAVSDHSGTATLFSRGGNSQSSLARSAVEFSDSAPAEQISVRLVALDSYIDEMNVPEPRWVKIDAEGAEIRILQGAERLLTTGAGIICELHPYAWAEFGTTVGDLHRVVAACGRRIRYLDSAHELRGDPHYGTVILERVP